MGKRVINIFTCDVCQRDIPDDEIVMYGRGVINDSYEFPMYAYDNTSNEEAIRKERLEIVCKDCVKDIAHFIHTLRYIKRGE